MIASLVRGVGEVTIRRSQPVIQMAAILGQSLRALASLALFNAVVFRTTVRQMDAVALKALPVVCVSALVLGSITVHYLLASLTSLGAYDRIGEYLIVSLVHETAPMTCAVILMFRSGTAAITEVAHMKLEGELDTLHMLDIPLKDYVYLPRVLSFALAGPSLTLVFTLVSLLGGYFTMGYMQDITFDNYVDQILYAVEIDSLVILLVKPLAMALAVAVLSIQRGMSVRDSYADIPSRLTQGLMYTVTLIIVVEVVFIIFS